MNKMACVAPSLISKATGVRMGGCFVLGTARALIKRKNIVLHSTNSKDQNR